MPGTRNNFAAATQPLPLSQTVEAKQHLLYDLPPSRTAYGLLTRLAFFLGKKDALLLQRQNDGTG
jgi:hypothetical protein